MSREKLLKIQNTKLQAMVASAYDTVPFYRRLYDAVRVDPSTVTTSASICRLPLVTKQLLKNTTLEERTSSKVDVRRCFSSTTSGSTGTPITILDTQSSRAYRLALWLRLFWSSGTRPLDRVCKSTPSTDVRELSTGARGLNESIIKKRFRWLSLSAPVHQNHELILRWKPDVMIAPPSFYRSLIKFSEESARTVSIKIALSWGEELDSSTRKLIENKMNAEVYDDYGTVEVGSVAWECPAHSGYHVNTDSVVVELLRDGEPVETGEQGELCLTNLYRKSTPMIRYLGGDTATFEENDCPCGRGLPLIREIHGRVVDYILTREGGRISPYIIMQALQNVSGIFEYKVTQNHDYSIQILIEALEGADAQQIMSNAEERLRKVFGDTLLEFKFTESIQKPRDGKFRIVESLVTR
jgi:phenylacetate-CoA ligase